MKTLKINGKEYKLEYSFEAAYDGGCVENVMKLIDVANIENEDAKSISNLPKTIVSLFFYGMLEHNPLKDENEAKELVKKYFAENKGQSFFSFAEILLDCMEDDGFLALLGIAEQDPQNNAIPMPQDHKKKETSKKTTEVSEN